jgi:tRNA pseudouridine32 synthase/23S rRNA pseudouridine746 synthase/23S rRNA pseudouridine1911/1915/1917 synthase
MYVDDHLFVVNKPAGVLAQADHTGDPDVLTLGKTGLRKAGNDASFLGLVHRLDRPTSGVMVLARTSDAARHLSRQFRERTVDKTYLAVVEGTLTGIGRWTDTIAKIDRQPQIVAPDHPEGAHAELTWQALARAEGRTLLQIQLQTGRPHQIRLQASERGHPVAGDRRYGAQSDVERGAIALHHVRIRVEHPETKRVETFTAPLPAFWAPFREAFPEALDRFEDAQ